MSRKVSAESRFENLGNHEHQMKVRSFVQKISMIQTTASKRRSVGEWLVL